MSARGVVCLVQGGCVPAPGGCLFLLRGVPGLGGGVPGPGGSVCSGGAGIPACIDAEPPPPLVNRMTNRCKNITLATTSLWPVISVFLC